MTVLYRKASTRLKVLLLVSAIKGGIQNTIHLNSASLGLFKLGQLKCRWLNYSFTRRLTFCIHWPCCGVGREDTCVNCKLSGLPASRPTLTPVVSQSVQDKAVGWR